MSAVRPRPHRHCMVVHAYYPVGETRVQRQAAALVDRGVDVDVLCLRDAGEVPQARVAGVRVYRLPVGRHRGRGLVLQLLEYLAFFILAGGLLTWLHLRRRYDSVQVHNLPDFLVFAAAVPKLTATPVLLDLHDLMPEFFAARTGAGTGSRLVRLVRLQERLACRFADHVITVTDGWRDTLVGRGVPADKVSVVMNLAHPRIFHRAEPQAEPTSGRPGGGRATAAEQEWSNSLEQPFHPQGPRGFHLLYHGTFTHRYGVDLLLEAVALVRGDVPGLRVSLLGAGDAREQLVAQRARLGLDDCVDISAGMLGADALPAAVRAADAGVVPNRSDVFTEGLLPTKLLELVAMGTPVIAARTATIASYFDDDMVEFFSPGNVSELAAAIRRLAFDPARRRRLADNADAFNRKYDWESAAAAYAATVTTAVPARRSPAAADPPAAAPAAPPARAPVRARSAPRLAAAAPSRPPTWHVRTSTAAHDPAWDEFLTAIPGGHHTQSSLWAQVKASMGWQAVRVIAERDGRVGGGAQVQYRQLAPFAKVGYVSRGPVLAGDDPQLAAAVMDGVERACRRWAIRHLTVQPPGAGEAPPPYLINRGYLESSAEVAPRATIVLDCGRDPDQMLAAMTSKTRYNVRLSGRRGVTVREGGAEDLGAYHRLLRATAARQGFTAYPQSYFEHMWRVLAPHGHIRLSLAEVDGEVLSGQIAIAFGDTVVNKLSVWAGQGGNRRPNEAIQWAAIQWAHAHGYTRYDLEGLKLKVARAIVAGEPLPDSAEQSVASFKLGFGGRVVLMPAPRVHVTNRGLRWAVAELYPRASHLRSVKAVVRGVRTQPAGSDGSTREG